jgi:hypothetical protein
MLACARTAETAVPLNERSAFIMKAETLLAKLNELRHEAEGNETDLEWLTLHHAFCFISYKMGDFQKYLDEVLPKD